MTALELWNDLGYLDANAQEIFETDSVVEAAQSISFEDAKGMIRNWKLDNRTYKVGDIVETTDGIAGVTFLPTEGSFAYRGVMMYPNPTSVTPTGENILFNDDHVLKLITTLNVGGEE